tara:strand:+ start:279 stop:968 length:690 start_codon:yes stop_codon:yes gene_type:complete
MIDHERKLIFIHIPRTAGMSITKYLGVDIERGFSDPVAYRKKLGGSPHHVPSFYYCPTGWGEYYTFTVIRNPWARLFSFFQYRLKGTSLITGKKVLRKYSRGANPTTKEWFKTSMRVGEAGFLDFIRGFFKYKIAIGKDYKGLLNIRPMTTWFEKGFPYSKVLRFETLKKDFEGVKEELRKRGVPVGPLSHLNNMGGEHYTEYYDDEAVKLVGEVYAEDVERFGYEFGD